MGMSVSRLDIPNDSLVEYPASERFIKLDINRYLELYNAEMKRLGRAEFVLIPPQIAIINAINNPAYRFICGALSRRTGKTSIANMIAQLVSLVPNKNVLIMSPNYNLSEISFRAQRDLIKLFKIEVEKDNAKDRIIELVNGSTIRMGSVSQSNSVVGRSYDMILFDEAALSADGEEAFNIALRPTLDRPGSKTIFISTPRGKNNWFSTFYQRGYSDQFPQWASVWSDYRENNRMGEADVDEARRSMSAAEFSQEYEASFVAFEGQIFSFNHDCIFQDEFQLPDKLEYIAGVDVGFKDPTGILVIGHDFETGCYYIVDEYLKAEKTTSLHAEKMKELEEKYDIGVIFIDAAAAQTRADWAADHDVTTIAANKSVLDGIARVQTLVEKERVYVSSKCVNTIAMLDQYAWDEKNLLTKERPKHDQYSHLADALRYALYTYSAAFGEV
jgi:phage terminase large subunit